MSVELSFRGDWNDIFDNKAATVFVCSDDGVEMGERVRADLLVETGGPRIILRGTVVEVGARKGTGFALKLGVEERAKTDFLRAYVRGGQIDLREKRRIPIRLKVSYGSLTGVRESFTRDINEEGTFVIADDPLSEGTKVNLFVDVLLEAGPLNLSGTVVHTVLIEDEDVPGMGIRFSLSDEQAAEMKKVVDDLEKRFLEGTLPQECLL